MDRQNDALLPLQNFDLSRFVRKAKGIRCRIDDDNPRNEGSSLEQWTEFGIAGINASSGYRAKIDMSRHYISDEWLDENGRAIDIRFDFDSLLGRSKTLPYIGSIEVYPLFGSGFRLKSSLHIGSVPLANSYVSRTFYSFFDSNFPFLTGQVY